MKGAPIQSRVVCFGLFEADIERRELRKSGVRFKLHDQPFEILTLLLERAGQVVTREELHLRLWPENTFVEFDNGLNVAMTKLRTALSDNADSPRFIETVPKRGYCFVAPISVRSTNSPATVAAENLTGDVVFLAPPAPSIPATGASTVVERISKQRQLIVGLLVVLFVLASLAAYRWRASFAGRASAKNVVHGITPRRSVAVLGFRNLPGRPEEDWLATAFSEMLSTELAAGGSLRMVSGEDISQAKRDLNLRDADTLAKSTLANLRMNPGADVVIIGSCTPIEDKGQKRIRIDVRAQDTGSGETVAEEAFTGSEQSLFEVAAQAGASMREKLGISPASADAMNAARASLPSNQQSERLYAEGRAKLWNFDLLAARDLLIKAVASDPENAAAHAALADAWSGLGYATTAQEQAKQAFDLSANLSREDQLSSEGRYRELSQDWPRATEIYRALTQFYPDSLEYGLRLAAVLSKASNEQESLLVLAALRRLPKPVSDDPRIDLQEASTFDHAADYKRLQVASANAVQKAEIRKMSILLAEAKLNQSQAAGRLDDPKSALAFDEEAQQIFEHAGDKYGVARARYRMGDLLFRQGQFAQSNAVLEVVFRDFRSLGNDGYVAATLNDIACGLMEMGETGQAKTMFEQSLVVRRLVRDKRGIADTMTNLGTILQRQGDLAGATRYSEEALSLYQEIGEKDATAFMQLNMSNLMVDEGNLSGAKALLDQSLVIQRSLGNSSDVAEVLHNLAEVLGHQGDIEGAKKAFDEALAIRMSRGEDGNVAQTRLGQADLMLESGKPADSESLVRAALEQFKKEKQVEEEASAHATLATTLLELGRSAEAKAEVEQATKLGARNEGYTIRLKTEIVAAQMLSSGGQSDEAARNLRRTINEARKTGFFVRQLQATLVLAEIEGKSGKKKESRDLLRSIETDARRKGFLLIARKAVVDGG
jgi:DNA-binding winged helix-turn-helix (wHTH) protein/tetratricopeptide (TPR) repeat protein